MDPFPNISNIGGIGNVVRFDNDVDEDEPALPEPDPALDLYRYCDGSGNSYTFSVAASGSATFYYRGIKPRESSSGIYNGGRNIHKVIPAEQMARIRQLFLQVEQRTAEHIDSRQMGTGMIVIRDGNERFYYFSLRSGAAENFERKLAELKQ